MKKIKVLLVTLLALVVLVACGKQSNSSEESNTVKLGVVGDTDKQIWVHIVDDLKKEGVNLEFVEFTDYIQPNTALQDGSIDANAFQHLAYLDEFNTSKKADLVPVFYTYLSPMAAYSNKVKDLKDLKDGAKVIIPNDPTNEGRALQLLELAGVISLKKEAGLSPVPKDIDKNPKHLQFEEVDAAQVPRSLEDGDVVIANTNYAADAGLDPYQDGIFLDSDSKEVGDQYKNAFVVRKEDKDKEIFKTIQKAFQTEATKKVLKEEAKAVNAWSDQDDPESDFEKVHQQAN